MYAIPPLYLMPIAIFYQLILVLVDSVMLGSFKTGYEVLGFSGVEPVIGGCISDSTLFLDDIHECILELGRTHVQGLGL